ncbi:GDP-6-deoxy-D-mannose reductase [Marinobacterium sp. xm-a-121]|uniref:UDP-glucose 4-epimerase family protein n=1 Tax=unclassified Marinobacterium TaxID=2644139 RepID=UPI001569DD4D|nr:MULTISPECIES: SDR family oxidoreductase [unclassified Marinobacterium]NRP37555.1 GDP-6-deoxy-D-mannose reductase [Marinobacterium sp. xm-a-121]NRP99899.1 GDP-6-deoxy-D-mannose reductase [Marinobacterium sp. xm-v-233]
MNILLTGASGFLGRRLTEVIGCNSDFELTTVVRRDAERMSAPAVIVPAIHGDTNWYVALSGQQVVIHAAARAHIMRDEVDDPLEEYRKVNVDGTLNLAQQATAAGVKRFIFISSIKVNGEQTPSGKPFTADYTPAPEDAYGISKWEAEQGLQKLAAETGLEVVIVRPPLVYGQGAKGNFASIVKLVAKGLPLPLGAINNQRSLVALDNLVDLIITCMDHPAAANQVFLAGDERDLSTTELLQEVAKAMSVPSRLLPVPTPILTFFATLLGKKAVADRLFGSLQVDISKTRDLLGWTPPISVEEGLRRCFESDLK